jgi:ABC-type transporter Mla subunit MlaD
VTGQMAHRLAQLRAELAEGQRALRQLDSRRDQIVANLLRLEGAIEVLEELLAAAASDLCREPDVLAPTPG